MQDISTGRMVPVPSEFAKLPSAELKEAMQVRIPRERQGALFTVGEIVELKGGCFIVRKIIDKGLVLHGIPR